MLNVQRQTIERAWTTRKLGSAAKWRPACLLAAAVVVGIIAAPAFAVPIEWDDSVSGDFDDGTNWDGGTAPGAADDAIFDTANAGAPYTVSFTQDETVTANEVRTDDLIFDLDGNTYTQNGVFLVGAAANQVGVLEMTGGGVVTTDNTGAAFAATIGQSTSGTGQGQVTVSGGTTWNVATNSGGTLRVFSGSGGASSLEVVGDGSLVNVTGGARLEASGSANHQSQISVSDGGEIQTGRLILQNTDLEATLGGKVTGQLEVASAAGEVSILVDSAGSVFALSGSPFIRAQTSVVVSDGGQFGDPALGGALGIGNTSGDDVAILVTGTDSLMDLQKHTTVAGSGGTAQITLEDGGELHNNAGRDFNVNEGGTLTLDDGRLFAGGTTTRPLQWLGGILEGDGNIEGRSGTVLVKNDDGTFRPGFNDAVGTLTFESTFMDQTIGDIAGTFSFSLASDTAHDQIVFPDGTGNTVTFNGDTIEIELLDGFTTSSNSFTADLIIASTITGVDDLNLVSDLSPSYILQLQHVVLDSGPFTNFEALQLQVLIVPEPSALGLLVLGLPLIVRRRRRKE